MKLCSFSLFPLLITMKSPCELASVVTHFEFSAFFQLLCWLHLWFKWLSLERVFCFSSLQCWSPAAPCWRFCSLSNRKEYPPTSAWCGLLISSKLVQKVSVPVADVEISISSFCFFCKNKRKFGSGVLNSIHYVASMSLSLLDKLSHLILTTNFQMVSVSFMGVGGGRSKCANIIALRY